MTLYMVATPIGNLKDITYRAVEVLKQVDHVFAEDTRKAKKLFQQYDIHTPVESLNARTERRKAERVIGLLREDKEIAIISDAGTPVISDPGNYMVKAVRKKVPGVRVTPIPGPSALTAALSVSDISASTFVFYGFLPHKKGRHTALLEISQSKYSSVIFESPHRIEKLLGELDALLEPDHALFMGRELTKFFEETFSSTAAELQKLLVDNPEKKQGEFVIIVAGQ